MKRSRIKLFFDVISNSLNPNSYDKLVSLKSLNENRLHINTKREKKYNRINKVVNAKIKQITT